MLHLIVKWLPALAERTELKRGPSRGFRIIRMAGWIAGPLLSCLLRASPRPRRCVVSLHDLLEPAETHEIGNSSMVDEAGAKAVRKRLLATPWSMVHSFRAFATLRATAAIDYSSGGSHHLLRPGERGTESAISPRGCRYPVMRDTLFG